MLGLVIVPLAGLLAEVTDRPGLPVSEPAPIGYLRLSPHYDPRVGRVAGVDQRRHPRIALDVVQPARLAAGGQEERFQQAETTLS